MDATTLTRDFHLWQRFSKQDRLEREHRAARRKIAEAGTMATRMIQAYQSMAAKGASENACYRTIYKHKDAQGDVLVREGWLKVRRIVAEGGTTRLRGTLITTFSLADGEREPVDAEVEKLTLEVYDEIVAGTRMKLACKVDRCDGEGQTDFITFLDSVRGDLKEWL
ncbi:hypothetical protein [Cobetia marina]|uniref:hypothetical protein n=1 Tax=Cobetia marina TaxID=28258 RepID=UPI001144E523|nr:hypothetical protein [Cobetia marina]GED42179.1 hypothetical protein HHA02_15080 [Cobetia marina]